MWQATPLGGRRSDLPMIVMAIACGVANAVAWLTTDRESTEALALTHPLV